MDAQEIKQLKELQDAYLSVYQELDEGSGVVTGTAKAINTVLRPAGQTPQQRDAAVGNITRGLDVVAKPIKSVLSVGPEKNKEMMQKRRPLNQDVDLFDLIKGHLMSEGYADTEESALVIMANMSEEWKQSIVEAPGEWFGGLRDKSRASRAAQIQSLQPTPKPLPSNPSPFAKPASKDDSGRLTTYGAGGGVAAERKGQTTAQVMQQGAANRENKNRNPGPNFGR
jgi:hypothetical protein